ncbi:hypothetical protein C100_06660 [Sphingobium sp. C100]|nr:hypothetical protein C100_06660 [Sphingobium sp. C100]
MVDRCPAPERSGHTADGFDLVDCGAPACSLTGVLKDALGAFMAVLDR